MQIKEIMSTQVQRIHQGASIQQAAEQMKTFDVGLIPVYDGDHLVGTITDRDISVRAVAEKRAPSTTKVNEVMSPGVSCIFEDQDVNEAAKVMSEKQIRRLIVLNRDKRLVGIMSLGDLATRPDVKQPAADTLESVSQKAA